jgi:hypothetical protein
MRIPKLPRWATVLAVVVSVASALVDPASAPLLVSVLGAHAAAKLAAIGAIVAGLGRSLGAHAPLPPAP